MGQTAPGQHVLQVITDTDRRGGQVFATDLHEALEGRGLEVRTVALAPGVSSARLDHDVLGPSRRDLRTIRRLRAEMAASSVVIGHGSTTLPMCAIAGVGLRVPLVYRQISQQLFWADTALRRRRTALALRSTDHVIALWRGAAEVVTSHFGVPAERISVIPNGVPPQRCPPVDPEVRRAARMRMRLDPDRPVLLSIGALVPEKGVDTLVRAMADPALDGWQLLIVGAGPEQDQLTRLAAELSDGAVCMRAPVDSGAEAIAAADVVGLTSRGGDSMPAVLIEAGMMGIPAVATPIEGIVDIVLDGRTGCIVAVDDAVATARAVAKVGSRSKEFGTAARTHCLQHFGIANVAERWHAVLDMLIAR